MPESGPHVCEYGDLHQMSGALVHAGKYLTRAGRKPGESRKQAIEKAIKTLQRELAMIDEEV